MQRFYITLIIILAFTAVWFFTDARPKDTLTDEQKLLFMGEKAFSEQMFDLARQKLSEFMKEYPDSQRLEHARTLLARSYYHLRDYFKSEEILAEIAENASGTAEPDILYWLGRARLRLGKTQPAIEVFDSVIAKYPEGAITPYARIDRAVAVFEQGRHDEGIALLDGVIADFPNRDEGTYAQIEKCSLLIFKGDYSRARAGLGILTDRKMPRELQSRMFFLQGEAEFYLKNLDEAIAFYKKSLATGTYYDWYPEAAYAIGWCQLQQGNHQEAMKAFEPLSKEHAGKTLGWKARLGMARAMLLQEKSEDASKILGDIILGVKSPSIEAEAKYLLGNAALAAGKPDESIKFYDEVIRDYTESDFVSDALFGKGVAYHSLKKYRESLEEFTKTIERTKRPELKQAALIRKADTLFQLSEYTLALEAYREVLKEAPQSAETPRLLLQTGWCYYRLDDYDSARNEFQRLLKEFPKSDYADDALYSIAGCHYRQGAFEDAIRIYTELKTGYPKSELLDKAIFQIATCYGHMGYYELAQNAYSEVVEKYPDSILADRAAYERAWCVYYIPETARKPGQNPKEAFQNFIKDRPKSAFVPEVLFWLSEQSYNEKDFAGARTRFAELYDKYPKSFLADEALYWGGRSSFEDGKFEDALSRFRELIEKFPASEFAVDSAYHSALALLKLGKTGEGLKILLDLRENPASEYIASDMTLRIAESYLKLDKPEDAFSEYKTLEENPERRYRAWGIYGMGLAEKERKSHFRAIELFMTVAWQYADQKEVAGLAYLGAGDCYALLGRKREAIDRYMAVVEDNLPQADEARKRILKLTPRATFD